MSFKKVGIAQDSNLRGDSLRLQNPDNTLAYSEFVYDGSATMSYTLPSSAGTSGQVLQVSSGTTLVWSTAVGPQGPIGPTGLPGSSGSSGSTGSSGSSGSSGVSGTSGSSGSSGQAGSSGQDGSSGTSGTSGSSGRDGVGDATMLGDVNYVPKYIGATALGTASMTSVGNQILFTDGSAINPSLAFVNDTDTGFYRVSANRFGIAAGGTAAVFGATISIANQTFFNKAVNHTPVTAVATASYVMDMSQSNVFLLTLTASTTLDYTNAQIGSYVIVATQNSIGNYSMSLAAGKFQGATWSGVATASNAKTIIQVIYDGSKGIITSQKLTDL